MPHPIDKICSIRARRVHSSLNSVIDALAGIILHKAVDKFPALILEISRC